MLHGSSVAGPYQDVVCPVARAGSELDIKHSSQVATLILCYKNAGLNVVGVSIDNYSANRKFYTELCGELNSFIATPVDNNKPLFLFLTLCIISRIFTITSSQKSNSYKKFALLKIAHRLTKKILHPSSIEKTNVKPADAVFHESTINALQYYRENGYPEFLQTANFMRAVCKM